MIDSSPKTNGVGDDIFSDNDFNHEKLSQTSSISSDLSVVILSWGKIHRRLGVIWFDLNSQRWRFFAKCYISPSPPKTALSLDFNSVEFNVCRALVEFQWLPCVSAAAALVPCNSI